VGNLAAVELGARLIEAEQRLADLPELEAQLRAAIEETEKLRREVDYLQTTLQEVVASPSWRLTAPLRSLRRMLARDRRG